MENAAIQSEKREKIDSIMAQMESLSVNFNNTEFLVQDMFDNEITTRLPMELQNLHPTITECHVLQKISDNGSMNGAQLAKSLFMTSGGVTKVMAKLTEKELVSRETSANNRKEIYFALTPSGKQIVNIHEVLHKKLWDQLSVALTEYDDAELRVFENILTKILKLLVESHGGNS